MMIFVDDKFPKGLSTGWQFAFKLSVGKMLKQYATYAFANHIKAVKCFVICISLTI